MCECNALVFGFRDFDYTISFWSLGILLNVKRMKTKNLKIMKIRICEHNVYREEGKNNKGPCDINRGPPCLLCFLFLPQLHGLGPS